MNRYTVDSIDEHNVAWWANMPITAMDSLGYLEYLHMRRDCFIYELNKTEKGRKYLDEAWLLTQTEPDRESSREMFARKH